MKHMSLEKRVFFCFVLLILFLSSGCHTTKYEWFPNRYGTDPDVNKVGLSDRAELGGIEVDVLKVSF
jgi:hypothetical protein